MVNTAWEVGNWRNKESAAMALDNTRLVGKPLAARSIAGAKTWPNERTPYFS